MLLRPIATAAQLPNVDQIADDVEFLAIILAQELEQRLRIARPCPKMNVGNPGRRTRRSASVPVGGGSNENRGDVKIDIGAFH